MLAIGEENIYCLKWTIAMRVFALVVVLYNHIWQLHCTCMRNKYPCKSEMSTYNCYKSCWRWSVSQFSTCMRLKFPDWQSNAHFPWQNEFTICPDIYGVQIPVKTSCTGQRWRKTKDFFVFCSGEIVMVFVLLLSVICVHQTIWISAQTPITAILSTHL